MAALDPLTAILNLGGTLIDRLIPDKTQAAQAKAQLLEMQVKGELDNAIAQLQVDQAEATSQNWFVASWRPLVGYVCALAFAYAFILQPLIQTTLVVCHSKFDPSLLPKLDMSVMMPVLLGMLGLAGARTYEKVNGVDAGH